MKQAILLMLLLPIIGFSQNAVDDQIPPEQTENKSLIIIINNSDEDSRVIVKIDSLERIGEYPDKLKSKGMNTQYKLPRKGMDYLFVYFTVTDIVDLKIGLTDIRLTKTNILCDNNKYYKASQQQFTNLSFSSTNKDKKGFIIFELPIEIEPTELRYFYQYRDDKKPKRKIKLGQINIPLAKDGETNE